MSTFYKWYIILKYNYYKIYWKFKRPARPSGFYGWTEYSYDVLDQEAVAYGVLKEN